MKKTWGVAFLTAAISTAIRLIPSEFERRILGTASAITFALMIPFISSFSVAWISEDPLHSLIAVIILQTAALFLSTLFSGADLGPATTAVITGLIILPASTAGIICATLLKAQFRPATKMPPRGFMAATAVICMLPAFASAKLGRLFAENNLSAPTSKPIDIQSLPAAPTPSVVSIENRHISQQHYLYGVIYFQKQDFNRAVVEWKKALKSDPGNQEARIALRRFGIETADAK